MGEEIKKTLDKVKWQNWISVVFILNYAAIGWMSAFYPDITFSDDYIKASELGASIATIYHFSAEGIYVIKDKILGKKKLSEDQYAPRGYVK